MFNKEPKVSKKRIKEVLIGKLPKLLEISVIAFICLRTCFVYLHITKGALVQASQLGNLFIDLLSFSVNWIS